jgi:LmbE family N-acetylglucosaminyl deacetylase
VIELPVQRLRSVLCLGAHCDDIEIGCGGTILRLLDANPGVDIRWIVFSGEPERAAEARTSAGAFLERATGARVDIEAFRERYFPYVATGVKEYFDALSAESAPDVIFTHYRADLHQDHRLLSELTYQAFRDQLILEYEIPKFDGDLGRPNVYVSLDAEQCERKLAAILHAFPSQRAKPWFTEETFRSLLRLRGVEAKADSGYAEAFHCRKLTLAW